MRMIRIVLALLTVLGSTVANAADVNLANQGVTFTIPAGSAMGVYYCYWNNRQECAPVKRFAAGATGACNDATFGSIRPTEAKICWGVAIESAPVTFIPFVACLPEWRADWWSLGDMYRDSVLSPDLPNLAVWRGKPSCGGKVQSRYYSDTEAAVFIAKKLQGDDAVNAWIAAQTPAALTAAQVANQRAKEAEYALKVPAVAQPVVASPVCRITAQSATVRDRQVYKPNASGTAIGSELIMNGVRVRIAEGTPVPCNVKIGSYYGVAGLRGTKGEIILSGYAIGTQQ